MHILHLPCGSPLSDYPFLGFLPSILLRIGILLGQDPGGHFQIGHYLVFVVAALPLLFCPVVLGQDGSLLRSEPLFTWELIKHVIEKKITNDLIFKMYQMGFAQNNKTRKVIAVTGSKNVWS